MRVPDFKAGATRRLRLLQRWLRNRLLAWRNAPTIHCIGDSHMRVMEYVEANGLLPGTRLEFCIVDGATITGLPNPNSKTQAGPIIVRYLRAVKPPDHILICLGEVDCGYLIWYRSQKYNESIDKHLDLAATNYLDLVRRMSDRTQGRVIVCSVPPPTISDKNSWGEVANARKEVEATQLERTQLTLRFNKMLSEFCEARGMVFLDLDPHLLDGRTGVVSERFMNNDPLDHHLDNRMYGRVIASQLMALGFQ